MYKINRAEFIRSNIPQYEGIDDLELDEIINLHVKYGTYIEILDGNSIIAAIRFNISHTGKIVYVLDMVIKPGYDSRWIMRKMIEEGKRRFPKISYLHFTRSKKSEDKPEIVSIKRFLDKIKGA